MNHCRDIYFIIPRVIIYASGGIKLFKMYVNYFIFYINSHIIKGKIEKYEVEYLYRIICFQWKIPVTELQRHPVGGMYLYLQNVKVVYFYKR